MKTILKKRIGKKGSFLGIGEFFSGVFSAVSAILDLIPKPIKFLLFFLIVLGFANIIQSTLGVFGVICNADNIAYSVPFPANIGLLKDMPSSLDAARNGTIIEDQAYTQISNLVTKCSTIVKYGIIKDESNGEMTIINNPSGKAYYQSGCSICDEATIYQTLSPVADVNSTPIIANTLNVCLGDAYHKNLTFWNLFCNTFSGCNPPENKHFSQSDNIYVCDSSDPAVCQDFNVGKSWNNQILQAGGTPMYPSGFDSSDLSEKSFIGIKCVDIKPKVALFNQIEIFDYKIWIMILLLIFVFFLYKMIKG